MATFKVYDIGYLSRLLGIDHRDFHTEVKRDIKNDFSVELDELGVENPDIGLGKDQKIFLVDPKDHSRYVETGIEISLYL